ncbi:39S ribosomal protein L37, mitochondrial [Sitophilus oryzae]|uniref:Large ribosomal subunit protein mL37 n=1 Tax=Sitophilus oryzae TaxID=7048 RepID=A0A6J2Y6C8_SITOR|nr:39S ribosomal protein L37, mitochondrial [Sitophilus oryzae]
MRKTPCLFRQHIGWHFQNHWKVQGRRRPLDTGIENILNEKGIQVENPREFLKEKVIHERVEVVGYKNKVTPQDKTHPNWHDQPLLTFKDNNVLLEGLPQAKMLTNSVEIKEGLPETVQLPEITKELNRRIKKVILGSKIFDAEQVKLPKVKDPERPAWNFPRSYGISQNRAYNLLFSKLLSVIESSSDLELVKQRYLTNNVNFSYSFEKNGDLVQFQLTGDFVLLSKTPLNPVTTQSTKEFDLPDLYPIKPTITLNEENIYVVEDTYPVKKGSPVYHPHTIFINFDKEVVKNLFEEEVTQSQIYARNLIKTFTAAASYAKALYGSNVKNLPTPVTLQAIQTDGKTFHFGILQLNTLDVDSKETKNVWYQTPGLPLFEKCGYDLGKPVLAGYNKDVVRHILAFYNSK